MIRLRYGILADYATPGIGGKCTAVGIFDAIYTKPAEGQPIQTPEHTVHLAFEGSAMDGPKHELTLKFVDPDGNELESFEFTANFIQKGDGTGIQQYTYFRAENRITLPDFGPYTWVVYIDGVRLGEIALNVCSLEKLMEGQTVTDVSRPSEKPIEDKEG